MPCRVKPAAKTYSTFMSVKIPAIAKARGPLQLRGLSQPEMIVFDEHPRRATAFPLAHLVGAEVVKASVVQFNFHTHVITVTAVDADAIHDEVLAGDVCVVTQMKFINPPSHLRCVDNIDVQSTGVEGATSKANDQQSGSGQ